MNNIWKDFSLSALVAGFIAVLTGYSSAAVIVFQAAEAAGGTVAQINSWMWALGISMGLSTFFLSFRYKMPIITGWSTPGAALLITSLAGYNMHQAIGAFLFCGVLVFLSGTTKIFERFMHRIPKSIAAALLAGILLQFGLNLFVSFEMDFTLALGMCTAYFLCRIVFPRYAVLTSLILGVIYVLFKGQFDFNAIEASVASPVWMAPEWHLGSLISVGIPLFIVTMASQNLPGTAVLQASGFRPPLSPIISYTGITTLLFAPFGAFAINLAAISAAVCTSEESHTNPSKRYIAGLSAGLFYILLGIFGAAVTGLFVALPKAMVMVIAGLALLKTLESSLTQLLEDIVQREAAVITFLVTASGISLAGIGSAFWGVIAGGLILWLNSKQK